MKKMPDDILVKFLHNESEARIPVKQTCFLSTNGAM